MRARNLKPAIYKNHELAKLGDQAFRLFTGLWCMADRKGRLKYEPEKIQAELFPFRFQDIDIDALLNHLAAKDDPFLVIYPVKGVRYIEIKNFSRHQHPHPKESPSIIPPSKNKDKPRYGLGHTQDMSNRADVLIPSSLIPDVLNPYIAAAPQTYPLPDPKTNPKACLVLSYKTRKGIAFDDRGWDKINFGRCMKAAEILLGLCKDFSVAESCLNDMGGEYDAKELTWTLETVARNAPEWLKKNGRIDGNSSRAGLRMAIAERQTKEHGADDMGADASGPASASVRDGKDQSDRHE